MWYESHGEVWHPQEPECFSVSSKPDGFWKGRLHFTADEIVVIPEQFITSDPGFEKRKTINT